MPCESGTRYGCARPRTSFVGWWQRFPRWLVTWRLTSKTMRLKASSKRRGPWSDGSRRWPTNWCGWQAACRSKLFDNRQQLPTTTVGHPAPETAGWKHLAAARRHAILVASYRQLGYNLAHATGFEA